MSNIYRSSNYHRFIYEKTFGPIPKDETGRSMEIHHIDNNHKNNNIDNLKLVTIQEHYDIHYSQGDFGACLLIANRMMISPEEKSRLAKENVKKQIRNGLNRFTDSQWQRQNQLNRVKNETHHFLGGEIQRKRVDNNTHHFLGGEIQSTVQHRLLLEGIHISQKKVVCEYCNRVFNLGNYKNWHGDKCKLKIT